MAMLKFITRCGFDVEGLRKKYLPEQKDLLRFPFDSTRKRMTTVIVLPEEEVGETEHGYKMRLHCKGASEMVLESCSFYMDEAGNKIELTDEYKNMLLSTI